VRAFPNELAPTRVPIIIPEDKVAEVVDFWVAWLGLTGWTHQITFVTMKEFGSTSQQGAAGFDLALQHFSIGILDPSEATPDQSYDMEETIVHELLHVVTAPWLDASPQFESRDGTLYQLCVEQPVERLSKVLTALGRAHPSHPLKKKRAPRKKARRK